MKTRTLSILHPPLARALARVGSRLRAEQDVNTDFVGVVEGLNALSPTDLARAEKEIFEVAALFHCAWGTPSDRTRLFRSRVQARTQLAHVPGLEYLFVFHRDGRLRESALQKISGGLPSAFLFAVVVARLNDWVPEVRVAAAECAFRNFPLTDAASVAEAGFALLTRVYTWTRWRDERDVLAGALDRADVAALMVEAVIVRPSGAMATVLRFALRSEKLDPHLERIAREAVQPAVRAVAAQPLIDGYAIWPEGWEHRWIDKSLGIGRQERAFKRRPLADPPPREVAIRAAAGDRSAAVRKVALDTLLRGDYRGPLAREVASMLVADRSPAVRERAEFILRQAPDPLGRPPA